MNIICNNNKRFPTLKPLLVPRDAGGHSVDYCSEPKQNNAERHEQRVPGELVAGVLAPAEPLLVVEPPEEDGDERGGRGEGEERHQPRQQRPAPLPHGDPAAGRQYFACQKYQVFQANFCANRLLFDP